MDGSDGSRRGGGRGSAEMTEAEAVDEPEKEVESESKETDHEDAGEDVVDPDKTLRAHHHRADPIGGGVGYGNMQPIVVGAWPELGLSAESSFM